MNLEQLLEEWDNDCTINDDKIDKETIRSPKLHSKYLRLLIQFKMKFSALTAEFNELRMKKFRYYRGEMGKDELSEAGWTQWQGTKPIRSELDTMLEGDAQLNKILIRLDYIKNMIEALESIMKQIASRGWELKNIVEWRKFLAGN